MRSERSCEHVLQLSRGCNRTIHLFFEPTAEEIWFHHSLSSFSHVAKMFDTARTSANRWAQVLAFWVPAQCPAIAAFDSLSAEPCGDIFGMRRAGRGLINIKNK